MVDGENLIVDQSADGWLHLAVVLDIGSRRVIGWSFRETLEAELVTAALDMALGTRPLKPGASCHSDRGLRQYASEDVQAIMERYQLRGSMSRKGNCGTSPSGGRDNAVVESFFASLRPSNRMISPPVWTPIRRGGSLGVARPAEGGWPSRGYATSFCKSLLLFSLNWRS